MSGSGSAGLCEEDRLLGVHGEVAQVEAVAELQPVQEPEHRPEVVQPMVDGNAQLRPEPPQRLLGPLQRRGLGDY